MQTYKITDAQLQQAAQDLRLANEQLAKMKKQADNAKEVIANRLAVLRGITIEALPIGEILSINGGFILIEIGKQNRFDVATFAAKHPEMHKGFMRDFPTVKYKINQ